MVTVDQDRAQAPPGYELRARLGGGQEGAWRAVHLGRGGEEPVVAKQLPVSPELDESFALLRKVSSPHLPEPLALLPTHDGAGAWLITRWVEGETLRPGPAPLEEVLGEAESIASALAEIQALGLHHGDVSPSNVVRGPEGELVLTDLGFLGQKGCGTPGFLAPEVLAGEGGASADVFALACLICQRLFGDVPWSDVDVLLRVRDRAAVMARIDAMVEQADSELPPAVSELLAQMLDPRADARPQDWESIVGDIRSLRHNHGSGAVGSRLRPRPIAYRGVALAAALAGLVQPDSPVRLVAIVGPPGSGRDRAVEESLAEIQQSGANCRAVMGSELLARSTQRGEAALQAWTDAGAGTVLGFGVGESSASGSANRSNDTASRSPAGLWAVAAGIARAGVVVATDPEFADELAQCLGEACIRVDLRPWTARELRLAARHVEPELLEGPAAGAAWLSAVHELTDSWPGDAIRALWACAELRRSSEAPSSLTPVVSTQRLARQLELAPEDALSFSEARAILHEYWSSSSGSGPRGRRLRAARERVGERLSALARAVMQGASEAGEPKLRLWLDADAHEAIDAWLRARGAADPILPELIEWAEVQGASLSPAATAVLARERLASGAAESAIEFCLNWPDDVDCARIEARARQQLGEPGAALARLQASPLGEDPRALGLRWRSLVDLDGANEAQQQIARWWQESEAGRTDPDLVDWASNAIWASDVLARSQPSDTLALPTATDLLARARVALDRSSCGDGRNGNGDGKDGSIASLRARALLLEGNAAFAQGDTGLARRKFQSADVAFQAAGEPMARVYALGNAAACAVPEGCFAQSVELGRSLVQSLLTAGLVQPLAAAVLNLIQALIAVGALAEAERMLRAAHSLHGRDAAELSKARLESARLELAAARLPRIQGHPIDGNARELATAMASNGERLAQVGTQSESAEQVVSACRLAHRYGWHQLALSWAEAARAGATAEGDESWLLALVLEQARAAAAVHAHGDLSTREAQSRQYTRVLSRFATRAELEAKGQLPLAFGHALAVTALLGLRLESSASQAARTARDALRLCGHICQKSPAMYRSAIEQHLMDDEDAKLLQRLVGGDDSPGATTTGRHAADSEPSAGPPPQARILRIYARLAHDDGIDALLGQVIEALLELTGAERGVVVVGDGPGATRVVRETASKTDLVDFSRSIIARVRETGEAVLTVDAAQDSRFGQARSVNHLNLRSVLAVPLIFRGRMLGVAYVDHRLRRGAFDESHLGIAEDFANLAALAIAHAEAVEKLRDQNGQLVARRDELSELLEARTSELRGLRDQVRRHDPAPASFGIVGASPRLTAALALIERIAHSTAAVVIEGEAGTGKELAARALHLQSHRSVGPFVSESCSAIPPEMMESVLFGHVAQYLPTAGAAGGYQVDYGLGQPGLIEMAHGGTLVLDGLEQLDAGIQAKLLRVIEQGVVYRIGDAQPRSVDVRIVVAATTELAVLVQEGRLRKDLFYRLNVVRVGLPALRDRREDIPVLIRHFLTLHGAGHREVSVAAQRRLARYPWPGNVRELQNEVARWMALAGERIEESDLSPEILEFDANRDDPDELEIKPRVAALERVLITRALRRTSGNLTQAAELLGLSRYGLQKKLRRISEDDARLDPEDGSVSEASSAGSGACQ